MLRVTVWKAVFTMDEEDYIQELCKARNSMWNFSIVPDGMQDGNFAKDRDINGEGNV